MAKKILIFLGILINCQHALSMHKAILIAKKSITYLDILPHDIHNFFTKQMFGLENEQDPQADTILRKLIALNNEYFSRAQLATLLGSIDI